MGMTGHHDVDAARDRIDLQGLQIVQNVERSSRKSNDLGFGVCNSPVTAIHISSDRGNRGDAAQRLYDARAADVAGMNYVVDASQAPLRLRPQQAVRIGDDPDLEGHRARRPLFRIGQPSISAIITTTARSRTFPSRSLKVTSLCPSSRNSAAFASASLAVSTMTPRVPAEQPAT